MPLSALSPTPYPDVNTVLQMLLTGVRAILDNYFIGLYLHGSLAMGDFDPGRSDIDFAVVTTRELPLKLIADLEAMHDRILNSGLKWAKKLDGSYISKKALWRYNSDDAPRPYVDEGKFFVSRDQIECVINRHILREHGVAVVGPPIKPLIAPVSPEELRQAIKEKLFTWWAPMLKEPGFPNSGPGYQSYAVITMCRALYALKFGTIITKPTAARWAIMTLDKEWTSLIEAALAWHDGDPAGDIERTKEFMRYTMEKTGALRP